MPFFPRDFFNDTLEMPKDAAAYYLLLLVHAWDLGGSLPNNERTIRNLIGMAPQRWRFLRDHIMRFWFTGKDGRLHQKRLDQEWRKAVDKNAALTKKEVAASQKNGGQEPSWSKKKPTITTRGRAPASGQGKNSLPKGRESSSATASLSVLKAHATPSPRNEEQRSVDPAEEKRIADGLTALAQELRGNIERDEAIAKLNAMRLH